jgi:hypothetical protein
MRASRENLGDYGGLVAALSQLQCSAHACATAANDNGVE